MVYDVAGQDNDLLMVLSVLAPMDRRLHHNLLDVGG